MAMMDLDLDKIGRESVAQARMAVARERHARRLVMDNLCDRRLVKIEIADSPNMITVSVGSNLFTDIRAHFPSVGLLARVQLAIAAGQSDVVEIETKGPKPYHYHWQHFDEVAKYYDTAVDGGPCAPLGAGKTRYGISQGIYDGYCGGNAPCGATTKVPSAGVSAMPKLKAKGLRP